MSQFGYHFYFEVNRDVLTFPITPSELKISVGSKNQVITLIGGGDINVLKSPTLVEIEFEARFPMRQYPYAREFKDFQSYYDVFQSLKEDKKSFRFIVVRTTAWGNRTWDTNLLVALEDFEIVESADEGDDVIVKFKLKQYKEYGVKVLKTQITNSSTQSTTTNNKNNNTTSTTPPVVIGGGTSTATSASTSTSTTTSTPTTTSTSSTPRPSLITDKGQEYTIKNGDTLWSISKKFYGTGNYASKLYEHNSAKIEDAAKRHGLKSSLNGQYLFPGMKMHIPSRATI